MKQPQHLFFFWKFLKQGQIDLLPARDVIINKPSIIIIKSDLITSLHHIIIL